MSSSIQSKQTQQQLVNPENSLNAELIRSLKAPLPVFSRLLAGGICFICFSALTWAAVSRVDEVATAQGDIIPSTRIQPIRALAGGLLQTVLVKEGEAVQTGEPLVKLNPDISEAEFQRSQQLLRLTQNQLHRLNAELSGQAAMGGDRSDALLSARLQESQAQINRQWGGVRAAQAERKRLQVNLKNSVIKARNLGSLEAIGAHPRLEYLDAKTQVDSLQAEIAAKDQEIYQAQQELKRLQAERKSEILTQVQQLRMEEANLKGQLAQARTQRDREMLRAPVSGIIYNVKVAKMGATVQPGEELMSIAPAGETLVLEAQVLNRDIGFVKPGMPVKIKLETFPYQEFGIVNGTVADVSPNSIQNQQGSLVYSTRIQIKQPILQRNGRTVQLTPGMAATAEIVIRQKTILSFLIEPLLTQWDQAFSVR